MKEKPRCYGIKELTFECMRGCSLVVPCGNEKDKKYISRILEAFENQIRKDNQKEKKPVEKHIIVVKSETKMVYIGANDESFDNSIDAFNSLAKDHVREKIRALYLKSPPAVNEISFVLEKWSKIKEIMETEYEMKEVEADEVEAHPLEKKTRLLKLASACDGSSAIDFVNFNFTEIKRIFDGCQVEAVGKPSYCAVCMRENGWTAAGKPRCYGCNDCSFVDICREER